MTGKPSDLNEVEFKVVCDATGSMTPWIEQTRASIAALVEAVANSPTRPNLRLALVEYRDHDHATSGTSGVTISHPFRADTRSFISDLRAVRCIGGADIPEAVADGLVAAGEPTWRKQAQKVVVLVGDAPPHGEGERDDNFPRGCPCGSDPDSAVDNLVAQGIAFHAIAVGPNAITARVFKRLAHRADGEFANLADLDRLEALLVNLARIEGRKVADDIAIADRYESHRGDRSSLAAATGLNLRDVDANIERLKAKAAIKPIDHALAKSTQPSRVRIVRKL